MSEKQQDSFANRPDDSAHLDEEELIRRARLDPAAFRPLFDRYHDQIFNYLLRRTSDVHLAKDLTSSTFLKALENIHRFRWRGISFAAWLYRIATNEVNLSYRNSKRTIPFSKEMEQTLRAEGRSDAALLEAEEQIRRNVRFQKMHRALSTLEVKYQTVLALRYFEDKSIREIAEITGKPENTVKTLIRRGLMQLREKL